MPPSRGKALVESLPKPPPSQRAARSDPFEGAFFAPGAAGQQGQRDTGMSCGQGMDRLGCLLCSSSTSSLNSCSISEGLPAFVPTALHAQQQEHLAVMRESLRKVRTNVGSKSLN